MNEAQLPPGQKWHNPDNLPSAGEPPWRFLVEGEQLALLDEQWMSGGKWIQVSGMLVASNPRPHPDFTYRTHRPLPAIPDPSVPAQGEAGPIMCKCVFPATKDGGATGFCMSCGKPIPSPVAPSGGEEEKRSEICPACNSPMALVCNPTGDKEFWECFNCFYGKHPTTPPPAEAPEYEQWHALPVTMASRSLSYQGKVLGTFGNETAMRLAATHNDEVAALRRELSAMRQERELWYAKAAKLEKLASQLSNAADSLACDLNPNKDEE